MFILCPIDLTALILRERGFSLDEAGFDKAMKEQKSRAASFLQMIENSSEGNTETFVGYDQVENEVK
jgi:alanyl-tRNA synthetase